QVGGGDAGDGGADHQIEEAVGALEVREVDDGARLHVEAHGVLIGDDTGDLPGAGTPGEGDALADRVLAGEHLASEALVDNYHFESRLIVAGGEIAAGLEGDAHGMEVAGADGPYVHHRLRALRNGPVDHLEVAIVATAREGKHADGGGARDARQRLQPADQGLVKRYYLIVLGILHPRQRHLHGQQVIGIEAGIDLEEAQGALRHQTRAYQQDDGDRHLGDQQQA